jgi:hypothetical protein
MTQPTPEEERRAAVHRERAEAIDGLREHIETLEKREPELRKEIPELERTQRATIAELEKTRRTTIAELERTLRADPENAEALEAELERTRTKLDEELARTRTELSDELARLRAELAAIGPAVIETRCTLGMKMSDFALAEDEDHEHAVEYLKPLLVELRSTYRRALSAAERDAAEAAEKLKELQAEHHETPAAALPAVEQRYQPLIDAEVIGVSIEQAQVRVARHQLALVEPDDKESHLARELELEDAYAELDVARAKVSALQEEKRAAEYHYVHPTLEKSKHLGDQLAKRFGRHH